MTPFDMHRVGARGTPERRCLTPLEMTEKGMFVNGDGFWVSEMHFAVARVRAAAEGAEERSSEHQGGNSSDPEGEQAAQLLPPRADS